MTYFFIQAVIFLTAAVVMVPIAKKLGLGSVLGYLIAGVLIGPVAGLVGDEAVTIQHFAEFGVVMMLFLVGLELQPAMLWRMKSRLLGLGGLQVLLSSLLLMLIPLWLGLDWQTALAIGMIFSLSSTAIVLQTFNEKGLTRTEGGSNAFSVLLFQDIAVIPMLAFLPLLAIPAFSTSTSEADAAHATFNLAHILPGWAYALTVILGIAAVVVFGHYLSRPLFRFIAQSGLREMFVACALLIVIGIAALMSLIGLSPALGTFLAGVVLANSEFKHELESNIEPFKGILLGLFFITVGAGIDFAVLTENASLIILATAAVIGAKALILAGLARLFSVRGANRWLLSLSLAQAGEFGFVLVSFALANNVLSAELAQLLLLIVALSMFLTPLLFIAYDKLVLPRYHQKSNQQEADTIQHQGKVIIAGIGRFGQIVNRLLVANGVNTVVLDHQAAQVDTMRAIDIHSYFGDATRPDLLHTAGIEEASLLVIAIDNKEAAIKLAHYVKTTYPHVRILARAYDRGHLYQLLDAGADVIQPETYHSALELGMQALKDVGFHPYTALSKRQMFRQLEIEASNALYQEWKENSEGERFGTDYRQLFMQFEDKIRHEMRQEQNRTDQDSDQHWTPPNKGYADKLG